MYLFDELQLRWCGFCLQPWPATLAYFARHKYGRHGLSSVCRWCSNEQQRGPGNARAPNAGEPQVGLLPVRRKATQLHHCHETNRFVAWTCRRCNLRDRREYKIGPRLGCVR